MGYKLLSSQSKIHELLSDHPTLRAAKNGILGVAVVHPGTVGRRVDREPFSTPVSDKR